MIEVKFKKQIWKDQYIDLALLLPQNNTSTNQKGLQFQVVANCTLSVIPNKPRYPLYNIEQWTTAFIRLMAIYAEKFPEAIPHLAKHAEIVREMATSQNSNAWFVYDQRVRMDRQARDLSYEVFNTEFYIMATRARDNNFSGTFLYRDNTFLIYGGNRPFRGSFRPYYRGARYSRNTRGTFRNKDLEVDIPEDYVGPLTGMDFAKCPTADSLTNVHNVGNNIQCSSASQTNIREITTQINQTKNNCVQPVTPVCHTTLYFYTLLLQNYDSAKANYLVCGFKNGFRIGFQGDRHFRASPNLKSASEFPEIMEEKLAKEISQDRIAGLFHELPFVNLHISPIGIVPKKEVGQYRLIHYLSYPKDNSINDHIPDELKTVHYSSIDDAIEIILNMGPNATMAKTDISNAFRIIPIHPRDHSILGIKFNGCFYFDQCLPMGCASSCSIFEEFPYALQWIAHTKGGITHIVHVSDDFLILSGQNKNVCNQNLKTFLKICNTVGVSFKEEKTCIPKQL